MWHWVVARNSTQNFFTCLTSVWPMGSLEGYAPMIYRSKNVVIWIWTKPFISVNLLKNLQQGNAMKTLINSLMAFISSSLQYPPLKSVITIATYWNAPNMRPISDYRILPWRYCNKKLAAPSRAFLNFRYCPLVRSKNSDKSEWVTASIE